MTLSQERIQALAREMVGELTRTGAARIPRGEERQAATLLAQVMIEDLKTEEEIDREARRRLRRMTTAPPAGSPEWEAILLREKQNLAARRGYTL